LWQPVVRGALALQQFLRVRVAATLFDNADADSGGTRALRESLRSGQTVEVAGYALTEAIAGGLEAASLSAPGAPTRVAWLEIAAEPDAAPGPASRSRIDALRAAGHGVDVRTVTGLPFWQTQEIAECPALIDATRTAVAAWR
jgi:exosortase A-associated hydrolase 2